MHAPISQDQNLNKIGKSPNPYQYAALDRKFNTKATPKTKTTNSTYPPLQSPYTRVYGKRWPFDKNYNTLNTTTKSNPNTNTYGINCIKILTYLPTTNKPISPYQYKHKNNKTTKVLAIIPIQRQAPHQEATIRHTQTKKTIPYQKMIGHIKALKHPPQLNPHTHMYGLKTRYHLKHIIYVK